MPNNTVTCVTAANNLTLLSVGLHITDTGAQGNEPNLHAQCITLYFREFSFRENLSRSLPCHSVSSDYGWRQWPLSGVAPDTVIIIIIIRQEFDLDRPVLALSKVFQVVFVHLVYNIVLFLALLLFIIVTRRSQFDLYLLGTSSAGSTFKSSKISSFLMWSKMVYPVVLMKKKIPSRLMSNVFYSFIQGSKFRFHKKEWGEAVHLYFYTWNFRGQNFFRCVL